MNSRIFENIFRFVAIMFLQIVVLNQIELHGFVVLYIYPLFILLLPFETPHWAMLFIGLGTGLMMDMFTNTPGMHAAATVLLAYCRPLILRLNEGIAEYEPGDEPAIASLGLRWFVMYTFMGVLLHHTFFFLLEAYSFSFLWRTIARIIFSTIASVVLMVINEYLFRQK